MTDKEIRDLVCMESIPIRFTEKQKKQLLREKEKTGKTISCIVREAVSDHFKKTW